MSNIFDEISDAYPKDMLARNVRWLDGSAPYGDTIAGVASAAWDLVSAFAAEHGETPAFPVPVREIAKRCGILIFEAAVADPDRMERDGRGAMAGTSALQMRERRPEAGGGIAGTVTLERNLSEYGKRAAIARELGAYVLRTGCVGPLDIRPAYGGPYQMQDRAGRLAALYGRFLLMPPVLVRELKSGYEARNAYNPLSYRDWIGALSDTAQVSDYDAVLGYDAFLESESFRNDM